MSVIVAGMEMPESCFDCEFLKLSELCICPVSHKTFKRKQEYTKNRHEDCHLKSVEGLIEKIKEHNEFSKDEIDEIYMNDVLKIIKKYCGMEG